jgi:hypothetical protein
MMQYFDSLTPDQVREIAEAAHHHILELLPEATTAIKYQVPFYSYFGNVCYLNKGKEHMYIGFLQGKWLTDEEGLLVADGRKQVRILELPTLKEVYKESTTHLILEAAWLNQERKKGSFPPTP